MTRRTRILSYDRRVHFFWFLASAIILLLVFYVYTLNSMTRNIAQFQSLEKEILTRSAELSTLEFSYIELRNEITIELAHEHGFKEARNPLYVSRGAGTSLSLNTPR